MKNLCIAIIGISLLAGCTTVPQSTNPSLDPAGTEPGLDWITYRDPQDRFTLRYPSDWLQTDATTEVQFWDNLDDDVNSVKMALIQETRTDEQIQSQAPEDMGPNFQRNFYTYDVNGHPTFTEVGSSDIAQYRTYYYDLADGSRLALIAWLHDNNEKIWQDSLSVQQSFQWVEGISPKE